MGETHLMGITYTREGAGAREYIPYSERRVFLSFVWGAGPSNKRAGATYQHIGVVLSCGAGRGSAIPCKRK